MRRWIWCAWAAWAGASPANCRAASANALPWPAPLVLRPKVLLLDEPLSALDKKLREYTQFELMRLQSTLGITFVMVTHDQDEAIAMSTRIAVMDQGTVIEVGAPREIYERPRCSFVADFIGAANILDAEPGGEDWVNLPGIGVPCITSEPLADKGWIALRPERIDLSHEPRPGGPWPSGVVEAAAFYGDFAALPRPHGQRRHTARRGDA
jgi:ABC-type Fe3+/spermidine/putrescine transport system ATPase subunit